jgi:PAS domain-containing protein
VFTVTAVVAHKVHGGGQREAGLRAPFWGGKPSAAEVVNKITPADISDPREGIVRAKALSVELGTPITPGFEALVFKASRGIEDIYELTYFRKDGSRFPAVVSVTALRDDHEAIIGYLLIGTDNTARKRAARN